MSLKSSPFQRLPPYLAIGLRVIKNGGIRILNMHINKSAHGPDAQQRRQIVAESACDARTLARFLEDPGSVRASTAFRIRRAAEMLGVQLPDGAVRR